MFFGSAVSGREEDPIYRRVGDGVNTHELAGREWIENLWAETSPFLDWDLRQRSGKKGHGLVQAFAEMYFAHALRANGISMVRRGEGKKCDRPDLFAEEPSVWIEIVAPELGTTADALQNLEIDKAKYVLRLRSAIGSKKDQLYKHAAPAGCIQKGDAVVIAISGAFLQGYDNLPYPPHIVQSVLGVGNRGFKLNCSELLPFVESRNQVHKINGSAVDTAPFFKNEYSHVSAVLYSRANWICRPQKPGQEFVLVHNPNATCPLPRGWLTVGEEYWSEDSSLQTVRYS